ncbi:hypothetical protein K461DRAFT_93548 [Myriangium duriaei CBS 260.36]|uniref:Uncharacterized protein n=1 Tax=Myriangium duriaei CBS 260.36 TaxID=1168546 RepID=A0A9P4J6G2_9PEZI|nr:hypothetical protein K461DRAFT_93548 [Myriangium duriaei CBS 260.36]
MHFFALSTFELGFSHASGRYRLVSTTALAKRCQLTMTTYQRLSSSGGRCVQRPMHVIHRAEYHISSDRGGIVTVRGIQVEESLANRRDSITKPQLQPTDSRSAWQLFMRHGLLASVFEVGIGIDDL